MALKGETENETTACDFPHWSELFSVSFVQFKPLSSGKPSMRFMF